MQYWCATDLTSKKGTKASANPLQEFTYLKVRFNIVIKLLLYI